MFADDMGIFVQNLEENYRKIRETISIYERYSGAKLNESKYDFIPLNHFELLDWIHSTNYKVLRVGEVTKYLGCPIGLDIQLTQELQFLLGRVRKRLRH